MCILQKTITTGSNQTTSGARFQPEVIVCSVVTTTFTLNTPDTKYAITDKKINYLGKFCTLCNGLLLLFHFTFILIICIEHTQA